LATISATKGKKEFKLKFWVLEARPQFLLLPVVLILVGTGAARYDGSFNVGFALLALLGLLLCHMSVNILNDYFDYRSGVDLKTRRTPFSGGSGMLPAGSLTPRQVWSYGLVCFMLAVPVGIYFAMVQGWQLLPLLVIGAVCVLFYTSVILKADFPEWSPGIGLGVLPVLGAYFVQTGYYSWHALVASVPSGLLVLNLLLLNEFPDVEADQVAHKKTLPIRIGKKKAALVYSSFTVLVYVWLVAAVLAGQMPAFTLIALLTLPLAVKSIRGSFGYNEMHKMMSAMGNNVLVVLVTQALIGAGYFLCAIS
jgi:1,4-dihydroxy-2-naphthoate polyprenyltransferase